MKKNYLLDWILFISGGICITTGLMLDFHLLPGGADVYRPRHPERGNSDDGQGLQRQEVLPW